MARVGPTQIETHEHASWESAASVYADSAGLLTALSGQLELCVEFGKLDSQSIVLDMGCGPGQLSEQLADYVAKVVGTDFSANMVEAARARVPALEFHVANGEELPFSDGSFDAVVCNFVAHHLARPAAVFTECRRVLKRGGRLVIVHPIQSEQHGWKCFAESLYEELPPEQMPHGVLQDVSDPRDYVELLSRCDFGDVVSERRSKPVVFDDIGTLVEAGWAVTGLSEQPQEVQERIRARTIESGMAYRQSDGTFSFPDVVLVSAGTKTS